MTRNFYVKFSFFIFIFVSLFIFSYATACTSGESCTTEGDTCSMPSCGSCTPIEKYKCVSDEDCRTEIQKQTTSKHNHYQGDGTCTCGNCDEEDENCTWTSCDSCTGCHITGAPTVSHHDNCPNNQVCELNGDLIWSLSVPDCENLAAPSGGQTENGLGAVSPDNVYLPVKLNWNDVRGAKSYVFRAWEATTTPITWEQSNSLRLATTTSSTTISEIIPTPCVLNSSTTFSWKITPCCYADRTICKNWDDVSLWRFNTNLAPESVSPYDPNWNNTTQWATDVPIPVTLDWCDVELKDIKSYRLRFYLGENPHPLLIGDDGNFYPYEVSRVPSEFTDTKELSYFIKNTDYRWEVATCFLKSGEKICSDYGQRWGFKTADISMPEINLIFPPDDPGGNKPLGLPITLQWEKKPGINSFVYEVSGLPPGVAVPPYPGVTLDYPKLSLVTLYQWRVKPCWDYEGEDCDETKWTDRWTFKTTGAKPTSLTKPANGELSAVIPVEFDWNDVPGAGSYRIQISTDAGFANIKANKPVNTSNALIDYPDLEMNTNYWWRVQSCAHADGNICGEWSAVKTFKTFELEIPVNRFPTDETVFDKVAPITFGCDPLEGAKSYQFVIYNPSGGTLRDTIVFSNSLSLNPFDFPDLGTHTWKIKACLTKDPKNCNVGGEWSSVWSFDVAFETPPGEEGGLVPCGRPYDDPNTPLPMNERDACQIHHIFLLFRNILDFLLWKVATIMLVLLSTLAGILFYISMGDSSVVFKVKSFLRSAIIGYLIIFFAWLIVNLFLTFIGFNFQIFGHWWEIKF